MKRQLSILAVMAAMFVGGASSAKASVYFFTEDHCTGGCGVSPFGSVTLLQNGTSVDFTVALFNSSQYVKTGAGDFQAFKFNATGVLLTDITIDAHVPGLAASTGAFSGDGTGLFGFGINCPTCGNGAAGAFAPNIVFHVANSTLADFITPNNLGFIFAADILSTNGNTGPVGAIGTAAPEPVTSALIGTGLVSLFLLRRRASR